MRRRDGTYAGKYSRTFLFRNSEVPAGSQICRDQRSRHIDNENLIRPALGLAVPTVHLQLLQQFGVEGPGIACRDVFLHVI